MTTYRNQHSVTGEVVGEYETDLAAYQAAQEVADRSGRSVVTYRLRADGRVAPGQEGVWSDPTQGAMP